jgi:uncharacterized protein (TIGR02757 family)
LPADRKKYLDQLYSNLDQRYIHTDPLHLVKQFDHPHDQEIAAVIMSSLAFGQVQQINKAGEKAFELMNFSPREFVESMDTEKELKKWKAFYYRMVRHSDMLRLLYALHGILKYHPTLGGWVASHYKNEDEDLGITWARCVNEIKDTDAKNWKWRRSRGVGFNHLVPDPSKKSACKRANLLLRWMVRRDAVDLGLWNQLPKEKLVMPVDTHIARIAFNIGLSERTDLSWKNANEITSRLKQLDPADPVKYDFALCRLGILKMCPKKRDKKKCVDCPIFDICRL